MSAETPRDSTVALATGENLYRATFKAIELLGGMETIVSPGNTVFIKPNIMLFTGPPTTTNPIVVGALVKMCKKAGAKKVVVGDLPIVGVHSDAIAEYSGAKDYVQRMSDEKCPVEWFSINEDAPIEDDFVLMKNDEAKAVKEMWYPKAILEADVFIDVPVAKTHTASDVTLGIKNLHGTFHPDQKRRWHTTEDTLSHKFLDSALRKYPSLTVTDAWYAGEGEGPYFMTFRPLGLVAASRDIVANDAVVSYLMGFDPMKVMMIRIGHERGFGIGDMSKIKVVGEDPEKHRIPDLPKPTLAGEGNTPAQQVLVGKGPTMEQIKAHPDQFPPDLSILEGITDDGLPNICRGCIMALKYVQTSSQWFFPTMSYAILVGMNPPDPSDLKTPDGRPMPVVLWGECACKTTKNYAFRQRGSGKPGGYTEITECPPLKLTMTEAFHEVAWDKGSEASKRIVKRYLKPTVVDMLELLQGNPSFVLGVTKPLLTRKAKEM